MSFNDSLKSAEAHPLHSSEVSGLLGIHPASSDQGILGSKSSSREQFAEIARRMLQPHEISTAQKFADVLYSTLGDQD